MTPETRRRPSRLKTPALTECIPLLAFVILLGILAACQGEPPASQAGTVETGARTESPAGVQAPAGASAYLDSSGREDRLEGGVRMIPVETPEGTFEVWTKRIGNQPSQRMLLLHGGPGATHEYLEVFDSFLPAARIEYYKYDQLGSHYSDQPEAPELWELERFVEEVEQVRRALDLGPDDFYLFGHSWGGILAMEYALKYPQNLKGLVISNMMASMPAYNDYAENVLMPDMDPEVLAQIEAYEAAEDYQNPHYLELLMEHHYVDHVLRRPAEEWPEMVNRAFAHINPEIYVSMQGPSELGASGKLEDWDRFEELSKIEVPTLVIGAQYDTMDPEYMRRMAEVLPSGRYLHCPEGSHMAMYDDAETYFDGLIRFVRDVDAGRFPN